MSTIWPQAIIILLQGAGLTATAIDWHRSKTSKYSIGGFFFGAAIVYGLYWAGGFFSGPPGLAQVYIFMTTGAYMGLTMAKEGELYVPNFPRGLVGLILCDVALYYGGFWSPLFN